MTTINCDYSNNIFTITIDGHAGFADPGMDIVCSAVSILSYSLLGYIDEREKILKYNVKPGIYELVCEISDESTLQGIKAILTGFNMLNENYEKNVYFSPKGKEILNKF